MQLLIQKYIIEYGIGFKQGIGTYVSEGEWRVWQEWLPDSIPPEAYFADENISPDLMCITDGWAHAHTSGVFEKFEIRSTENLEYALFGVKEDSVYLFARWVLKAAHFKLVSIDDIERYFFGEAREKLGELRGILLIADSVGFVCVWLAIGASLFALISGELAAWVVVGFFCVTASICHVCIRRWRKKLARVDASYHALFMTGITDG